MKADDTEQKIINILLDKDIVSFSFDPPYVFTTGLKSPIYIDNRLLISYPKERAFIVSELVKLIKAKINLKRIDYISSSLSFAAPFGVLIAEALNLPLVLIKEQQSSHGKKNKIEGHLPKGKKALIVEDHISTGAAVVDNIQTVRDSGGEANYCVAITDFEIDVAKNALKEHRITAFTLTSGSSIVDEAVKEKKISEAQKKDVLEWLKNPVKWGEVRGYYGED
ncbi:hypothetical protein HY025_03915 [Candidatus Daviesbacteria bacterium]|nr:hypothetical protein [Candidatus Daviesbacteria bacterium]